MWRRQRNNDHLVLQSKGTNQGSWMNHFTHNVEQLLTSSFAGWDKAWEPHPAVHQAATDETDQGVHVESGEESFLFIKLLLRLC